MYLDCIACRKIKDGGGVKVVAGRGVQRKREDKNFFLKNLGISVDLKLGLLHYYLEERNGRACNDSDNLDKEGRYDLFDNPAQEPPVCKIRRFDMIKYLFGQEEEYVAVKEYEYDDLTRTNKDAWHAYQEIFRNMDEGWLVTRAE
ncbi:hypothetical protein Tco_1079612 [Tanacetum coccineum]|uniref:Uncharacterized protein n=1 Tax=Tanacetum coccineum TaxID=301880 RepID=A0ABQ5HSC6_9ASTR